MRTSASNLQGIDEWRILTWNVQGSRGFDLDFIRSHIIEQNASIVLVQEIQRRQARRLGQALQMEHRWARKHTPFPGFGEGLAILARDRISSLLVEVVTPAAPWSWRRRIVVGATVTPSQGQSTQGQSIRVLNLHLSAHGAAGRRARELAAIASINSGDHLDVIAGDFNTDLDAATSTLATGHRDTSPLGPPTCWAPGPRTDRSPQTRLDAIFVDEGWVTTTAMTPTTTLDRWARVSDHLPVDVTISPRRADPQR